MKSGVIRTVAKGQATARSSSGFTTLRKAGGQLKLVNLNRRNIELLVLTKLTAVFEIFTDEQDAVNSFFPGREVKKFDILNFVRRIKETGAKEDGES